MNDGAGKGDTYRKVNRQKWSDNYETIFKKKVSKNEYTISRIKNRRANSVRGRRSR
jgi:hypothetical protein